jgi:hypothetical protein
VISVRMQHRSAAVVALDGTHFEANASKHKAMDYGRLIGKQGRSWMKMAAAEEKALPADAEANDEAEDQPFGPVHEEVELPLRARPPRKVPRRTTGPPHKNRVRGHRQARSPPRTRTPPSGPLRQQRQAGRPPSAGERFNLDPGPEGPQHRAVNAGPDGAHRGQQSGSPRARLRDPWPDQSLR